MKQFVVDSILSKDDICNLEEDFQYLTNALEKGAHIVFFGRRNMGKTSLVVSKVIPEFVAKKKNSIAIFVDLLGVASEDEVCQRIQDAIGRALIDAYPAQATLSKVLSTFSRLRPLLQLDPMSGETTLSFAVQGKTKQSLEVIFNEVSSLALKYRVLLVMDEFQDIHSLSGMDAKFRSVMQKMPPKIPILIMGSKKHLLASLFSLPQAPLAGWGIDFEISTIHPQEFKEYLNERFTPHEMSIEIAEIEYLCQTLENVPEAVLYVCITLSQTPGIKKISMANIDAALNKTIRLRQGRYAESLRRYSDSERRFLRTLTKSPSGVLLTGKEFLSKCQLSSGGVRKIVKKLEDIGIIYQAESGMAVSDPLLARYIRSYL